MALTPTWTPPNVWDTGEPMSDVKFNTYIQNNLLHLHQEPDFAGKIWRGNGVDTHKTSTSVATWERVDENQFGLRYYLQEGFQYILSVHVTVGTTSSTLLLANRIDDTYWLDGTTNSTPDVSDYKKVARVSYPYLVSYEIPIPYTLVAPGWHNIELYYYNPGADAYDFYLAGTYAHYTIRQTPYLT